MASRPVSLLCWSPNVCFLHLSRKEEIRGMLEAKSRVHRRSLYSIQALIQFLIKAFFARSKVNCGKEGNCASRALSSQCEHSCVCETSGILREPGTGNLVFLLVVTFSWGFATRTFPKHQQYVALWVCVCL